MTKAFGVCFWVHSSNCCLLTKRKRYVSQGTVATLFRWAGKCLNYCIANLFRTTCTKFYQNQLGFVEDMTKNILVCFFGSQCNLFFCCCSYLISQLLQYVLPAVVVFLKTMKQDLIFSMHTGYFYHYQCIMCIYMVGQKTGLFLEVRNSCKCWA